MQQACQTSIVLRKAGVVAGIWWISSYPKSGNTWLRAVIETLIAGRPADINAMSSTGRPPRPPNSAVATGHNTQAAHSFQSEAAAYEAWAAQADRPLYCKTHDPFRPSPAMLSRLTEAALPPEELARAREPLISTSATLGAIYIVRDPRAIAVSLAHHLGCPIDEAIGLLEE